MSKLTKLYLETFLPAQPGFPGQSGSTTCPPPPPGAPPPRPPPPRPPRPPGSGGECPNQVCTNLGPSPEAGGSYGSQCWCVG